MGVGVYVTTHTYSKRIGLVVAYIYGLAFVVWGDVNGVHRVDPSDLLLIG